MGDNELMEIVKGTINTGGVAGMASAEDAAAFIDLSVDQTAVLQQMQVITGIARERNVDSLTLGEPVIVPAVEGAAPASDDVVAVQRGRKVLRPRGVLAAFDVTFDFLRQNIRKETVNEDLNCIFAKRFGKDVVLAAFNGDTAMQGATRTAKALRTMDGLRKQHEAVAGRHEATGDAADDGWVLALLGEAVQALPKDYRDDRDSLRFFCNPDLYDAYADAIGARATVAGDQMLLGSWDAGLRYKGVRLVPTFGFHHNGHDLFLTPKDNAVIGFGREMTFGVDVDNRARLLKVTITADVDVCFAVDDAVVYGSVA